MWPPVEPQTGPRQSEAPHPLPWPWNVCSAHHSHSGSHFQGHSLEGAMCYWDGLDRVHDWTQLSPLSKLKILVGRCKELLVLRLPKTTFVGKFLCLLNMPPTNLEWSASFFGLFLPSSYGGQFQISPGKLPTVPTNSFILGDGYFLYVCSIV